MIRPFQNQEAEELKSILENMQDAFCAIDKDWTLVMVNRHYEHLTQTKRMDVLGKCWWELFPEMAFENSMFWTLLNKVKDTGLSMKFEEHYGPLDIWLEVRADPTNGGGIALFFNDISLQKRAEERSFKDIEDQKRLAEKIESQNAKLEIALKARDEFLSIASHELKTPLTSLKLHSQMFKRAIAKGHPDAYSPERIDSLAAQAEKQVSKLNALVDDMLDISRIRSGNLALRPSEFELCGLIKEVLADLKDQFILYRYPSPLFQTNCENILVNWDKERIEQILLNLLTNSIRFGESKQVSLHLTVENETVHIALKDNGRGIAEENRNSIFNCFEKIGNPSEAEGLGLGLYIARKIVEAHRGKIWVESELGVGSEFKIKLPKGICV
ncbi:MAG: ATP-binding protein [Bacteriovorax sp.]